jgi:hypothetical protein
MPMVNGKSFPYTSKGKAEAKKAAVQGMVAKKKGKKSKGFSGVASQIYGG